MIPKDSFFKNIPSTLDLRQRLPLEGAGWAIDFIFWSFGQLRGAAALLPMDMRGEAAEHIIQGLFVYSWSIIDQCHMLRKLLERLELGEVVIQDFVDRCGQATLIRNAMDHLHKQIGNLATLQQARPPIFGALSYCMVRDQDFEFLPDGSRRLKSCTCFALTAGALTHRTHHFEGVNPAGRSIELPIGLVQFEAFDHMISFSELAQDLTKLVRHFDEDFRKDFEQELGAAAREKGLDEEKALAKRLGRGLRLSFDFAFPAEEPRASSTNETESGPQPTNALRTGAPARLRRTRARRQLR